jgi:hypothetical protein
MRLAKRGVNKNRELGVVLAMVHRVWPLASLALALFATVGWMGLLGYVAIKLL